MKRAVYTFTLLLFVRMTKMTKMAKMVKMTTSNQEEHQWMTTSSLEDQRMTAPKQEHQRIVTTSTGSESEQKHPKPIISVPGSPSFNFFVPGRSLIPNQDLVSLRLCLIGSNNLKLKSFLSRSVLVGGATRGENPGQAASTVFWIQRLTISKVAFFFFGNSDFWAALFHIPHLEIFNRWYSLNPDFAVYWKLLHPMVGLLFYSFNILMFDLIGEYHKDVDGRPELRPRRYASNWWDFFLLPGN